MFRKLVLIPLSGLLLMGATGDVGSCGGFTPSFEIYPVFPHVTVDYTLRSLDLGSKDAWGAMMRDHTSIKNSFVSNLDIRRVDREGTNCQVIKTATIIYRVELFQNFSNNYPVKSCQYAQVEAHAKRHLASAQNFQRQAIPVIEAYLRRQLKGKAGLALVRGDPDHMAWPFLQTRVNDELKGYAKYLDSEYNKFQLNHIDNKNEMQKLFAGCPGWKIKDGNEE